jgi:hypothetical protein
MKNKTALIVTAVLFLLIIGGGAYFILGKQKDGTLAGNNGQQTSATLGQKDIDEAVTSVKKWFDAYYAGDFGTACKLATDNYVESTAANNDAPKDCKGQVISGSALAKAFGIEPSKFTYSGRIENGVVIVTSKWTEADSVEDYEMVKEGGAWKVNAAIKVTSEEEKKQEAYNQTVEEWNNLSQEERDSWYNADETGGFEAFAKNRGVEIE